MISEPQSTSPTLTTLVDRIRLSAIAVGIAFIYISATVALVLQREEIDLRHVAMLVAPLGVTIAAFMLTHGAVRAFITALAAAGFITAVLLLPTSTGMLWPPIASLSFAFGVIAVAGLPLAWGLAGVLLATAFTRIGVVVNPPRTLLISTDLMDGWVTPLSVFTLTLAFLLVLRAWSLAAAKADGVAEQVRVQLGETLLAERVDEARRAVDRRLHETLLNTLAALSAPAYDYQALREQCARDLTHVTRDETLADLTFQSVLAEAVRRVPGVDVHVECSTTIHLPDTRTTHVVGDALVELLRNVERHSGTREAWVSCKASVDAIDITVSDQGFGLASSSERFGLRSTVSDSMRSIGGRATLLPNQPRGTQAVLHLPLNRQTAALEPPTSLTVLLGSPTARLALAPTLFLGVVALPFAVAGFAYVPWILLGFAITLGASTALAIGWDHLPRIALAWVVLLASLITMALAALGQQGCSTATGLHWIIYAEAGAITLSVLAFTSLKTRGALVALIILASLAASSLTPEACLIGPLDAAIENAIWIVACIGVVSLLSTVMDRHRIQENQLWLDLRQADAAVAARESAETRWRSVNAQTWTLVGGVAAGDLEPGTDEVRNQAGVQEARLRALLDVATVTSMQLHEQVAALADEAATSGVALSIQVLDDRPEAVLGESEVNSLRRIITDCSGYQVQLVILPDAVMCQVPSEASGRLPWDVNELDNDRAVITIGRTIQTSA